jgi:D-glycero-alpha-D-manno-heptose 1-phosphate guanylyltransferase
MQETASQMQAIVLAGGLGTRLRGVLPELPKPMAPIKGRPFLAFLLDGLVVAGFDSATLAVGYRHERIRQHFGEHYRNLALRYSMEEEPLGTGGAIRLALGQTTAPQVFVLNGDTYLELDYQAMLAAHMQARAAITLAVRQVPDAGRYGALDILDNRIQGFFEKGRYGPGVINAGVYLLSRDLFDRYDLRPAFSFETDLLVPHASKLKPLAFEVDNLFIDIGIPEDYRRAQSLLSAGSEGSCPEGVRMGDGPSGRFLLGANPDRRHDHT